MKKVWLFFFLSGVLAIAGMIIPNSNGGVKAAAPVTLVNAQLSSPNQAATFEFAATPNAYAEGKRNSRNIPLAILVLPPSVQGKVCLALNVYYEARGESVEGMRMVAYVTDERKKLNRPYWGGSICENVFKKNTQLKKIRKKWVTIIHCEFSWACQELQPKPNLPMWSLALVVAGEELEGEFTPEPSLQGSLYYLRPKHSSKRGLGFVKKLVFRDIVDHHHFYGEH